MTVRARGSRRDGFTGRQPEIVPERTWETRSQVVAADPGREFAWEVNNGWVRWGFSMRTGGRHPTVPG